MKIKFEEINLISLAASLIVHGLIFTAVIVVLNVNSQSGNFSGGAVRMGISTSGGQQAAPPVKQETMVPAGESPKAEDTNEKDNSSENGRSLSSNPAIPEKTSSGFLNFTGGNGDTTGLDNVYAEPTLNVRIKYPAGWSFIDQNVKKKLDGVTFVAANTSFNPPPYVHLAVTDKDLFIENRYKYKIETGDYTAYYNEPEEMAGQVSQVFYLRTETDEDYTIKFIMNGRENFKALQPTFFGMIKSFKFGSSWF